MKKIVCLLSALVLLVSLGVSAMAADFVPSISYKDGPGIAFAWLDEENVTGCLVITSIKQAQDKTTDITQQERDALLKLYEELKNGTTTLPEDGYTILELVDVNFKYEDCRLSHQEEDENTKLEELNETSKKLKVQFKLGVAAGTEVIVYSQIDGKLVKNKAVNNGDGTVTCEFDHLCPVVFAVKESQSGPVPPQTGDETGKYLPLWIGTLALSGVALVTLVVVALKKKEQ